VDFKKVVWHESFYKILESIEIYSKIGCWVGCGDGVRRLIYPIILILAADYEEQYVTSSLYFRILLGLTAIRCVMAHNRGTNCAAPCPRCLVKLKAMWDPSVISPPRTSAGTQELVRAANQERQAKKREAILQPAGLRGVEVFFFTIASILYDTDDLSQNVFWKFGNSDPYQALSFDRLHTFPGGLFRAHLWKYLQAYVGELGRAAATDINNMCVFYSFQFYTVNHPHVSRAKSVPRWAGLNHFSNYISENFTDGSKWEDMSKVQYTTNFGPSTYGLCSCLH
jgi:hypothetical protein